MNARSDKATISVNHWLAAVYSAAAARRRGKQPAVSTVLSRACLCSAATSPLQIPTIAMHRCRWLLLSLDRLQGTEMAMTQELIANMLGIPREARLKAHSKYRTPG